MKSYYLCYVCCLSLVPLYFQVIYFHSIYYEMNSYLCCLC